MPIKVLMWRFFMIKILQYVPGFREGGIESRLLDWYRNINRTEIQFILVKLNRNDDTPNIKEFLELGGKFYNLPPFGIKSAFTFKKQISDIIRKEKIQIVHVHDPNSGMIVLKAAKDCNIKCRIFHSRTTSFLPDEKNVLIKKIFMSQTPKFATDFWACSKEAGIWGCGKKHEKELVVINNGIQEELFNFDLTKRNEIRKELSVSGKKVIGCVCRLSSQKNIPFLLDIVSKLIEEDNNYVLLLVGSGDENILKKYYSQKKDISKNVLAVGSKKNVWDYYMAMDVFCGTSLYEGFGTTAIESQATGLPTILSYAFPDTVQITNFVRRIKSSNVDNWVNAIHKFEGKRFPKRGIEGVINHGFSAIRVAKNIEEFYKKHV